MRFEDALRAWVRGCLLSTGPVVWPAFVRGLLFTYSVVQLLHLVGQDVDDIWGLHPHV